MGKYKTLDIERQEKNTTCSICNEFAGFEVSPEGECCSICDSWVCNNCVDWKAMSLVDIENIICKNCSSNTDKHKN